MDLIFPDRRSAGIELARKLAPLGGRSDTFVLGLPRGGLPVAAEVALALEAPLDIVLVRKIGSPLNPELALGAVSGPAGRTLVRNTDVMDATGIDSATLETLAAPVRVELERRRALWQSQLQPGALAGKHVILVDDGIATGATMRAAIAAVRADRPAEIVVAASVASREALDLLSPLADGVVCLAVPAGFTAVGQHYLRFPQVSDDEVRAILDPAGRGPGPPDPRP